MKVEYTASTLKGKLNIVNQDRVFVDNSILSGGSITGTKPDSILAIVCDGVGSDARGNYAAEIVTREFLNVHAENVSPQLVNEKIKTINRKLLDIDHVCFENSGNMTTTVAGLAIHHDHILIFNVGDTRIYALNTEESIKITEDHIEIESCPSNSDDCTVLTKWLGGDKGHWYPTIRTGRIKQDVCYFLICSDGFYNSVNADELYLLVNKTDSIDSIQSELERQLSVDTDDDASWILIKMTR